MDLGGYDLSAADPRQREPQSCSQSGQSGLGLEGKPWGVNTLSGQNALLARFLLCRCFEDATKKAVFCRVQAVLRLKGSPQIKVARPSSADLDGMAERIVSNHLACLSSASSTAYRHTHAYMYIYIHICIHIDIPKCVYIYTHICLYIQSACILACMHVCLSGCLFIYLHIHLSIHLSICLFIYLSIYLSIIYPSVYLSGCFKKCRVLFVGVLAQEPHCLVSTLQPQVFCSPYIHTYTCISIYQSIDLSIFCDCISGLVTPLQNLNRKALKYPL